ncbi:porimin-like [Malaya genurostris]|uniref:porimin-like n=1 Tax=Malaya genurostris TaxID=325434 RepID=UPI0026F3E864|nr:porimin-like [Malaya genurostris]
MDDLEGTLPATVQRWTSSSVTTGWSMFVGKVEREIKRAKLQIECDMSADANVAIEYVTVFNSLVEEQFCKDLDEYYTSTTATSAPTTTTTSTSRPTTTTTTTVRPSTTTIRTTPATTSTTVSTTTSTLTPTTTTTVSQSSAFPVTTTTTELPVDPTSSSTEQVEPTTLPLMKSRANAAWIALSGVFVTLFILSTACGAYLYFSGRQINRLIAEQFPVKPIKNINHHANNYHPTPLDNTIHRKLQEQLKNRLQQQQQQHSLAVGADDYGDGLFCRNDSPGSVPHKYPRTSNVNLKRDEIHFRDISKAKHKSRLNKL